MHDRGWIWRRWQLVSVVEDGEDVVLDAFDLSGGPVADSDLLITLAVCADDDSSHPAADLGPLLRRWSVADDGLCDAFFQTSDPMHLAILHGSELLVVAAASRP